MCITKYFTVQKKLMQHCKLTILQFLKKTWVMSKYADIWQND